MSRSFRSIPVAKWHRHHNKNTLLRKIIRAKDRMRLIKAIKEENLDSYIPATLLDVGERFDDPILRSPRSLEIWCTEFKDLAILCRK